MTRKHKVISTKASIPKGMLIRNDVDIVDDSSSDGLSVMGVGHVQVLHQHHHTEGKKINEGLIWNWWIKTLIFRSGLIQNDVSGVYTGVDLSRRPRSKS
ncbi:hypothetical protein ACFX13_031764 [Malus domestica]